MCYRHVWCWMCPYNIAKPICDRTLSIPKWTITDACLISPHLLFHIHRKIQQRHSEDQRKTSYLQDLFCKTGSVDLELEKVMNTKKFALMFLWSLHCLKISLRIFTSHHHTMQLLKQGKLKDFRRISWHLQHLPYTALARAGRNS